MDEGKTGKMLYKAIKNKVLKNDAALEKNFVGIVSDQAASMIGPYKGVAKRLKNDFPYIVATNDLSHISHLITKHSVKSYPSQTLQIIKDLSNHFAKSCQRRAKFRSVQKKMKLLKIYDIKNFTKVRWLSLAASLSRIINLWEPLKIYFEKYGEDDEINHFTFQNELYLRNLLSLLELLVHYNLECQKQKLLYDQLLLIIQESFIIFAKMVVSEDRTQLSYDELSKIPFKAKVEELAPFIVSLENFRERWIQEHTDIQALVSQLPLTTQTKIFEDTMKLVLKILSEIQKRLPFEDQIGNKPKLYF